MQTANKFSFFENDIRDLSLLDMIKAWKQHLNYLNNLSIFQKEPVLGDLIMNLQFLNCTAGLEIKKNSKSPFGNHQRKNGRQMQKCSRQLVQEQKLRLEPHLIDIVVRLLELNTLKNILW